jgi:hypothetical protein
VTLERASADVPFEFLMESIWLDWEVDASYPITGRTVVLQDPDTLERFSCG